MPDGLADRWRRRTRRARSHSASPAAAPAADTPLTVFTPRHGQSDPQRHQQQQQQQHQHQERRASLRGAELFAAPLPPLEPRMKKYLVRLANETSNHLIRDSLEQDEPGSVLWQPFGSVKGIEIARGVERELTEAKDATCLRGATEVNASIEEFALLFKLDSRSGDDSGHGLLFDPDLLDMVTLYPIVQPSGDHPRRFVGIKWCLVGSPNKLFRRRDFCFLECQKEFTDSRGRRGWVRSMHSVKLPCCPPLDATHGVVRASLYRCGLTAVETDRPGVLNVTYTVEMDLKGRFPDRLQPGFIAQRIAMLAAIDRFLQRQRLSSTPLLGDLDIPSRRLRTACQLCYREFGAFHHRRQLCRKCGESVCKNCSDEWLLDVPVIGQTRVRICTVCSAEAKHSHATAMAPSGEMAAPVSAPARRERPRHRHRQQHQHQQQTFEAWNEPWGGDAGRGRRRSLSAGNADDLHGLPSEGELRFDYGQFERVQWRGPAQRRTLVDENEVEADREGGQRSTLDRPSFLSSDPRDTESTLAPSVTLSEVEDASRRASAATTSKLEEEDEEEDEEELTIDGMGEIRTTADLTRWWTEEQARGPVELDLDQLRTRPSQQQQQQRQSHQHRPQQQQPQRPIPHRARPQSALAVMTPHRRQAEQEAMDWQAHFQRQSAVQARPASFFGAEPPEGGGGGRPTAFFGAVPVQDDEDEDEDEDNVRVPPPVQHQERVSQLQRIREHQQRQQAMLLDRKREASDRHGASTSSGQSSSGEDSAAALNQTAGEVLEYVETGSGHWETRRESRKVPITTTMAANAGPLGAEPGFCIHCGSPEYLGDRGVVRKSCACPSSRTLQLEGRLVDRTVQVAVDVEQMLPLLVERLSLHARASSTQG